MARIAGVDLPNKHVVVALTYIYGIGRSAAKAICEKTGINPQKMMNDLDQDEQAKLRALIDAESAATARTCADSIVCTSSTKWR